jgi:succinyl-CoA---D-citramalate CoA-transferase
MAQRRSALGRDRFPWARSDGGGPLKGVRVIDAGTMVAAPFSAVLLADFGADVIKIEHPRKGDGERKLEPIKGEGPEGVPLWWKVGARNKRCITLDLSKPAGAQVFRDLVATADIVAENYRPGTFEGWGLGYEELKSVNPNIILLRISGFGQSGPYRRRAGFGRIAEAMGGLTNLIGERDGPPMTPGVPLGDVVAGLTGAWATMLALYHRDACGGHGQVIDLALYESIFRLLEFDAIQYDQLGSVHTRDGNELSYVAPSSMFRTTDGYWITLAASNQDIFEDLCRAMGREDLLADPRFTDNPTRVKHRTYVNGIVGEWIAERTRDEVAQAFDPPGVPYSSIFDMRDVFENQQYLSREMLVRVPDDELGDAVVPNVVPKLSETPGSVKHLGPRLGQHNDEIYIGELGYSEERMRQLRTDGVV